MIEQSFKKEKKSLDPVATKAKILAASIDLFSREGFHAVSFAQISEATQLPKSLVAYHFGTKDELWSAVTASLMKPGMEAMDQFLSGQISVGTLLQSRLKLFAESPTRSRFIAWMSLTNIPMPDPLQERKGSMQQRIHNIDPEVLTGCLLAISLMDGWYLNRRTYSLLVGEQAINLISDERMQLEIAKLLPQDISENQ